jgi:hypothetical protein
MPSSVAKILCEKLLLIATPKFLEEKTNFG